MKVVILAGGFGTRLSEYTHAVPKPMKNRQFTNCSSHHTPLFGTWF